MALDINTAARYWLQQLELRANARKNKARGFTTDTTDPTEILMRRMENKGSRRKTNITGGLSGLPTIGPFLQQLGR